MTQKIPACTLCGKNSIESQYVDEKNFVCSECEVDESFHAYLRALRRKKSKLTFPEWLFLLFRG